MSLVHWICDREGHATRARTSRTAARARQWPTVTAWVSWSRLGSGSGLAVLVTLWTGVHPSRVRVETTQSRPPPRAPEGNVSAGTRRRECTAYVSVRKQVGLACEDVGPPKTASIFQAAVPALRRRPRAPDVAPGVRGMRSVSTHVTDMAEVAAALLAGKLTRGRLPSPFTARDLYRNEWTGLTEPRVVPGAHAAWPAQPTRSPRGSGPSSDAASLSASP